MNNYHISESTIFPNSHITKTETKNGFNIILESYILKDDFYIYYRNSALSLNKNLDNHIETMKELLKKDGKDVQNNYKIEPDADWFKSGIINGYIIPKINEQSI